jgi:uncharacterized protein YyaL (SSP411 family)
MANAHPDKKPNHLIHSTSPYLLQHAYNPVEWYEWGEEALSRAREESKPILVSIGYSSCHWCHVMERESFENTDIAQLMNAHFICIKVDREERPDIDQVYMDAVQAMGIHGGWPLNVFLTTDQKPFFGGTYFSPSVWTNVLKNIYIAYETRKYEIHQSAEELAQHLAASDLHKYSSLSRMEDLKDGLNSIYTNIEKKFDPLWGGVDKAPKFIMPSIWQMLLRYNHLTENRAALQQVQITLNKILDGGIYDQIGGGFARYSVDAEWFAPHFEKMLYDNAQLISLYSEAYSVTYNPDYKRVVFETFDWLNREMCDANGGYYSALDADSEGEEGRYYTWTLKEITDILTDEGRLFASYFGVIPEGNWEHGRNILKRIVSDADFIREHQLTDSVLTEKLNTWKSTLLAQRNQRIKPGLDDKILTGWNAMMILGLLRAYHTFDYKPFLESALKNISFLERNLMDGEKIYRSFKGTRSSTEGFLDDYAYVLLAYLQLYQSDFNEHWLYRASGILNYVIRNFFDPREGLFYYSSESAEKLIARKKEIFDNVIPSSNSLMAIVLYRMGVMLDNPEWKTISMKMVDQFSGLIQQEPNYMSNWGIAYMEKNFSLAEVAIVGQQFHSVANQLQRDFLPFALFAGTENPSNLPLLKDKSIINKQTTLYVCRNYSCQKPVHDVDEAKRQILNKS